MYQGPEIADQDLERNGWALKAAAASGDTATLQALLSSSPEWGKWQALHSAVEHAQVDSVRALLIHYRVPWGDVHTHYHRTIKTIFKAKERALPDAPIRKWQQILALLVATLPEERGKFSEESRSYYLRNDYDPNVWFVHAPFQAVLSNLLQHKDLAQLSTEALFALAFELAERQPPLIPQSSVALPYFSHFFSTLRRTFGPQLTVPPLPDFGKGLKELSALARTSKEGWGIQKDLFFHILSHVAPGLPAPVLTEVWDTLRNAVRHQTRDQTKHAVGAFFEPASPAQHLRQRVLSRVTDEAYRRSMREAFERCKALYTGLEASQTQGYAELPRANAWELSCSVSWLKLAMEQLSGALNVDAPAVQRAQKQVEKHLAAYEGLVKVLFGDSEYQKRLPLFNALRWALTLPGSELYRLAGEERLLHQPAEQAPSAEPSSRKQSRGKEPEVHAAAKRARGFER